MCVCVRVCVCVCVWVCAFRYCKNTCLLSRFIFNFINVPILCKLRLYLI